MTEIDIVYCTMYMYNVHVHCTLCNTYIRSSDENINTLSDKMYKLLFRIRVHPVRGINSPIEGKLCP